MRVLAAAKVFFVTLGLCLDANCKTIFYCFVAFLIQDTKINYIDLLLDGYDIMHIRFLVLAEINYSTQKFIHQALHCHLFP